MLTVSVCVAAYKQERFMPELLANLKEQIYPHELVIYEDKEGLGTGEAFNRAVAKATGDIIVLLCADDLFADKHVLSDIVAIFDNPEIGHVSRFYYQFVDGDRRPVRAWRSENILELANNPSGLAFRRDCFCTLSNRLFLESADSVWRFLYYQPKGYQIMRYDTVAVRIHKSNSRNPNHYAKYWHGSIVKEWAKMGWRSNDYASLIQISVNASRRAVISEIREFISANPKCLFNPLFSFFCLVALLTPKKILYVLPEIYRSTIGRTFTREIKRK